MKLFRTLITIALTGLAACGGVDVEQAQICEYVVEALEEPTVRVDIVERSVDPDAENAVMIRYEARRPGDAAVGHWVSCRFAGSGLDVERLVLTGVATDRRGALSQSRVHMLHRFWLRKFEALAAVKGAGDDDGRSLTRHLLYFLQLSLNALSVSCVYGLLAMAYTLIYGIIGRINLAFGEFAMLGAYATLVGVHLFSGTDVALALALVTVLAAAVLTGALWGWTAERTVFRPLLRGSSQAVLIATIGLAIFLQEAVRLSHGARERWVQQIFGDTHTIAAVSGFSAVVTTFQLVIVAATVFLFVIHRRYLERSRFGLDWRACAQDSGMATLCGVDAGRTLRLTFALGGAYAAMAGCVVTLYYGGASFYMGTLLGFKALTAAIVGGIGSVTGAIVGAVVIGFVETYWSGYLEIAYRDIAVFGLLAVVLIFRPEGLVARSTDALTGRISTSR